MEVDFAKNAVENGKFTLGKEVNIDFSKIVNGDIQGVNKIDLSAEGENKLLNLTLDDVLSIGKKDGSGNFMSKKEDKQNHGIGLKSVNKIVESYGGFIEIRAEDSVFRAG